MIHLLILVYICINVNIYVKGGEIKRYNSEVGIVGEEESNSGYFMNIIYPIIFFGLFVIKLNFLLFTKAVYYGIINQGIRIIYK